MDSADANVVAAHLALGSGVAACARRRRNSIARHFADWGATSRFGTGGEFAAVAMGDEPMHFEQDIKPLFREGDRDAMRFAFDLWSHDDVSTQADAILGRLEAGTMPCDGAWPAERVAVLRQWIDAGKPA